MWGSEGLWDDVIVAQQSSAPCGHGDVFTDPRHTHLCHGWGKAKSRLPGSMLGLGGQTGARHSAEFNPGAGYIMFFIMRVFYLSSVVVE